MATRSFEFVSGVFFLFCGGGILLLRRFFDARSAQTLKEGEVFNGITVLQFYFGIGIGALFIGSALVLVALLTYA